MKFELVDYHRNVSDEELISDVIHTAIQLDNHTLTAAQYTSFGKYHSSTLTKRFGTWKKVLELAGLDPKRHCRGMTNDEVISDVKRVAALYGKESITKKEYDVYGMLHSSTLEKRFNGWNTVLTMAGMKPVLNRNFTKEEMLEEIERVWISLGRQPTSTDIKNGVSKYSLQSYIRRFGGWRGALQAFIEYINADDNKNDYQPEKGNNDKPNPSMAFQRNGIQHSIPRDVNLRLRFRVFQRDHFKCCACGASPAKDPSVVLHVDHIKPWSKGGETVFENLQTYCSKCNLGKSDL